MNSNRVVVLALVVMAVALALAWFVVLDTPTAEGGPIRNAYWPFTVEVEVWDVGASPWDHRDRPTDLDRR